MENDIKEMRKDIRQMLITQAEQKIILEEHMKRTKASEDRLKNGEARLKLMEDDKLKVRGFFVGSGKILGIIALVLGIVLTFGRL